MTVQIGQPAPDFTLTSHTGEEVSLSQFRGVKPVVIVFGTSVSGDDLATFESAGAQVLVVAADAEPAPGSTYAVLADDGTVTAQYGGQVTVVAEDGTVVDRFEAGAAERYAEAVSRL